MQTHYLISNLNLSVSKRVIFASLPILITAILSGILSSLTNFLLAKIFNPSDFALFRIVISSFAFLAIFLDFGVSTTLTRYLAIYNAKKETDKIKNLILDVFKLKFFISVLVIPLILIFKNQIAVLLLDDKDLSFLITMGMIFFIFAFFDIAKPTLTGLTKFKLLSLYNLLLPGYGLAFSIILAMNFGVRGAVIANAISYLIIIALLLLFFIKKNALKIKQMDVGFKNIFSKYSLPVYFANLPLIISIVTIPILAVFFKLQTVGLVAFSLIFYNAFTLLPQSIYHVLLPEMSTLYSKTELTKLAKILKSTIGIFLIISIPTLLIFFVLIKPTLRLFLPSYMPASPAIQILTTFAIISGISTIYTSSLNAQSQIKKAAFINYLTTFLLILVTILAAKSIES